MPTGIPLTSTGTDLYHIREWFARISGRHDLVTDFSAGNYEDNGCDYYINAGQKTLDRMFGHIKQKARHVETLAVGGYYLELQNLRAVERVYKIDSDGDFEPLKELELHTLLYKLDTSTNGTPEYWAHNINRVSPELVGESLSSFDNVDDIVTSEPFKENGIIFNKPTDEALTIQIYGRFFEDELYGDDDTSWWTKNHPTLLVWAAIYNLEIAYNNITGAKNWLDAIRLEIVGQEKDQVEFEDTYDVEEIIG